jgi:putative colanic acid biosysnthesis UDP-glucose lipid carrier transferase
MVAGKLAINHLGSDAPAEEFSVREPVSLRGLENLAQRRPRSAIMKRALDLMIAGPALLCLLPFLVMIAVAIKLESRGPILFRQKRRGLNGTLFKILKFRTMFVLEDGSTIEQARREDCRVTRVGRWLRCTSLDELPQLVNVIKGEMSIVGPRPHAQAHDEYYGALIENYIFRQVAKPGITGWAQINGARGPTPEIDDMRRRVELDLWYVQRRTLALDLKIIILTAVQIIRNPNAF